MQFERGAIRPLADEVDRLHRDAMRAIADGSSPTGVDGRPGASRRSFLKKVGVGGAVLTVGGGALPSGILLPAGAQEDDQEAGEAAGEEAGEETGDGEAPESDAARSGARFAQTLELAVVELYGLAADRFVEAGDDELRTVAETFGEHHQEHADAISENILVQSDQEKAETVADDALLEEYRPRLEEAADVPAIATILAELEERLCATYFRLLDDLADAADAKAVALMLPVDAQHAVVWHTALEQDPAEYLFTFQAESPAEPFTPTAP